MIFERLNDLKLIGWCPPIVGLLPLVAFETCVEKYISYYGRGDRPLSESRGLAGVGS